MSPKRPPRDITPSAFFEQWLPALFREEFGEGGRADRVGGIHVRVRLDGEGGGTWDLRLDGGKLTGATATAGAAEAPVTVLQSVADWRLLFVGEDGAVDMTPPRSTPLDILFLDSTMRQLLQTVRGSLRFEVSALAGRTWALTTKFGDHPAPATPDATITVDAETYTAMLTKKLAPTEAYFGGKIKIAGNVGLAMQLAMTMLPRFT